MSRNIILITRGSMNETYINYILKKTDYNIIVLQVNNEYEI